MNDMSVTRLKILSLLSDISTNGYNPRIDRIAVLRVHKNKTHFFIRLKGGIGIRGAYMCYIQTGLYRYKQFTFCNINDLQIKKLIGNLWTIIREIKYKHIVEYVCNYFPKWTHLRVHKSGKWFFMRYYAPDFSSHVSAYIEVIDTQKFQIPSEIPPKARSAYDKFVKSKG